MEIKTIPGEIAALICLDAEYICLTKGILFINHSPSEKTAAPIHDETKTPTKSTKSNEVTNPSPASETKYFERQDTETEYKQKSKKNIIQRNITIKYNLIKSM